MKPKKLGEYGEDLAVKFLQKKGYQIVERNFRIRVGEIDIVAKDNGVIVFVEVKARSGSSFGPPSESVTTRKQQQISKAALAYLSAHSLHDREARFDVVSVLVSTPESPTIELIKNAFDLCYG